MIARFALPLIVVLFLAADDADKDAKKELEKLQGDWTMASLETQGKKADNVGYKLTIKDDLWSVKAGDGPAGTDFTIKLDPSKDPKQIDMTRTMGNQVMASLGIYKLDGDTLTLCRAIPGKERPKEFKTTEDTGILVVWKKVKK